jgi:hypothetical protein
VDGVLELLGGGEEPTGGHSDGDGLEVLDHVPLPLATVRGGKGRGSPGGS